jgi:hypothetical protein
VSDERYKIFGREGEVTAKAEEIAEDEVGALPKGSPARVSFVGLSSDEILHALVRLGN